MVKRLFAVMLVLCFLGFAITSVTPAYALTLIGLEDESSEDEKLIVGLFGLASVFYLLTLSVPEKSAGVDSPQYASLSNEQDKYTSTAFSQKLKKSDQGLKVVLDSSTFGYFPDVSDGLNTRTKDVWQSPILKVSYNW